MDAFKPGSYICTSSTGISFRGQYWKLNRIVVLDEALLQNTQITNFLNAGFLKPMANNPPPETGVGQTVHIVEPVVEPQVVDSQETQKNGYRRQKPWVKKSRSPKKEKSAPSSPSNFPQNASN